jgi:hypothetical protein
MGDIGEKFYLILHGRVSINKTIKEHKNLKSQLNDVKRSGVDTLARL